METENPLIYKKTSPQSSSSPLDKFIKSLEENKASPADVALVLADALYATDKHSEPDYGQRIKAAEMILKALRLLGPNEQLNVTNNTINLLTMEEIKKKPMRDTIDYIKNLITA